MKLFVYHTPELTPADQTPDCAIAVDVLRATSTIATALASGAAAVQVFSDFQQLMQVSEQWPPESRLRAGERGGATVAGCDLGNSPLDCTPQRVQGKRLFMSTTNGTRCLERLREAEMVTTAALINRKAVVDFLVSRNPETVWIVGSGWEGAFALEDTVCAGAIAHSLISHLAAIGTHPPEEFLGNDEGVGAVALYLQWQNDLLKLLHQSSHGKRLLRLDCQDDLKYCAQLDVLNILPIQQEPGLLIRNA